MFFPLVTTLVLGAIVFVCLVIVTEIRCRPYQKFKGPKRLPLIGNARNFWGLSNGLLHLCLQCTKEYGRIFKVHDTLSVHLVVSDAKLMEAILSSPKMIDKAEPYKYFHSWLGTGLVTSSGEKWRLRRKMLTPSFHFAILENFIDVFDNVGNIFVKRLEKEIGKSSVDIYDIVTLCTLDIICETAMGISMNTLEGEEPGLVKATQTMCRIINDRIFSSIDAKLYSLVMDYFEEKRAVKILHDHTDAVIKERMKNFAIQDKDNKNNVVGTKKKMAFLDLLLTYTIDGKLLSTNDIREEVETFMLGGHDTLSSVISFILYALANNPEVQKKVYEELEPIFDDMKHSKTKSSHLSAMKYLELVIKEVMRLYPPFPIIGRKINEDFECDGVVYPKGLNFAIFIFAAHRDPEYFSNPESFIPERWIDDKRINNYTYIPFSAGPRNCIGQKFAMLEMKSLVSKVLRNFELLPADPEHVLKLDTKVILLSQNGIRIRLKKRN